MAAKGINIAEEGHVVMVLFPRDITGGVSQNKGLQRFNMANYAHASIMFLFGVTAAAATALKIYNCQDAAGTGRTAIAFNYYSQTTTASGDVLSAKTAATSSGIASPGDQDGSTYLVELDASELSDGYNWVEVEITAPGSSILCSVAAILSGSRYAQLSSPTVLS